MDKPIFRFIALQEAGDFINSLPVAAQRKIFYTIDKVAGGIKDVTLFKKLDGTNIWEFRIIYQSLCYRLFAFLDREEETFVIATHGIIKKSQKTPSKEIKKAEAIRINYLKDKNR